MKPDQLTLFKEDFERLERHQRQYLIQSYNEHTGKLMSDPILMLSLEPTMLSCYESPHGVCIASYGKKRPCLYCNESVEERWVKYQPTLKQFLDRYIIKLSDANDDLNLLKTLSMSTTSTTGCPNCNDINNIKTYQSETWTKAIRCVMCKTLSIIVYSNSVNGVDTDTIFIYNSKKT